MATSPLDPTGGMAGGALALGGLAYELIKGPDPLPSQVGTITNQYAPTQWSEGTSAIGQGQQLVGGGTAALNRASKGYLTPEQQAQLTNLQTSESNAAYQAFADMGITPGRSTQFLSSREQINTDLLAASQSFVQTNIALAMSEIQAGIGMWGVGAGLQSAASTELANMAGLEMKNNEDYANAVSAAFGAVAKAFSGGTTINVGGGGNSLKG